MQQSFATEVQRRCWANEVLLAINGGPDHEWRLRKQAQMLSILCVPEAINTKGTPNFFCFAYNSFDDNVRISRKIISWHDLQSYRTDTLSRYNARTSNRQKMLSFVIRGCSKCSSLAQLMNGHRVECVSLFLYFRNWFFSFRSHILISRKWGHFYFYWMDRCYNSYCYVIV